MSRSVQGVGQEGAGTHAGRRNENENENAKVDSAVSLRPPLSPLERAKQVVAGMVRSEKEARWLGLRMENFLKAHARRMESVTVSEVCDYLEGLVQKGQLDWQVKQSLDAVGLLMRYGYQREDLMIPALREAWGLRLNQRVGISVPEVSGRVARPGKGVDKRHRQRPHPSMTRGGRMARSDQREERGCRLASVRPITAFWAWCPTEWLLIRPQ